MKPKGNNRSLRLVIINKLVTPGRAAFSIKGLAAGARGKRYMLVAPKITSTSGMTFGGVSAEAVVAKGAKLRFSMLDGQKGAAGAVSYSFPLPAFSAALVNF